MYVFVYARVCVCSSTLYVLQMTHRKLPKNKLISPHSMLLQWMSTSSFPQCSCTTISKIAAGGIGTSTFIAS